MGKITRHITVERKQCFGFFFGASALPSGEEGEETGAPKTKPKDPNTLYGQLLQSLGLQ
jgi:hypothetical protein